MLDPEQVKEKKGNINKTFLKYRTYGKMFKDEFFKVLKEHSKEEQQIKTLPGYKGESFPVYSMSQDKKGSLFFVGISINNSRNRVELDWTISARKRYNALSKILSKELYDKIMEFLKKADSSEVKNVMLFNMQNRLTLYLLTVTTKVRFTLLSLRT